MTHPLDEKHPLDEEIEKEIYEDFEDYPFVELLPEEMNKVEELAAKKETKPENKQSFEHSNRSVIGFAGELAFIKHYQLSTDIEFFMSGGDDGYDFEMHHIPTNQISKVDVKTRDRTNADLLIPESQYEKFRHLDSDPSIYYLIEKRDNKFAMIGWIRKEDVKSFRLKTDKYPTPTYEIPRDNLNPPVKKKDWVLNK